MLGEFVMGLAILVTCWNFYNSSLSAIGLTWKDNDKVEEKERTPSVTVMIPARNEERVLERLMERLLQQQYDRSLYDIMVLESNSVDRTLDVCRKYEQNYNNVRCVHLNRPGKSAALNEGLKMTKSDIIAIFDADTVPRLDVISSAVSQFKDDRIAAVQGKLIPLNVRDSIIARFAALEELFYEYSIAGRAKLGFFVPLEGTCMFIRRKALEEAGGWNERVLTEDLDLSLRLTAMGYRIAYSPSVIAWREVTVSLKSLILQRLRWYRGHLEFSLRGITVVPSLKLLDGVLIVLTPVFMAMNLVNYSIIFVLPHEAILTVGTALGLSSLVSLLVALVIAKRHLIGVPYTLFSYVYMQLVVLLHLTAILMEITRRPRTWVKTERTGTIGEIG